MIDGETLRRAADLIEEAVAKLDTTGSECPACGHRHFGRWGERQMSDELEATIRKLRKFAQREGKQ